MRKLDFKALSFVLAFLAIGLPFSCQNAKNTVQVEKPRKEPLTPSQPSKTKEPAPPYGGPELEEELPQGGIPSGQSGEVLQRLTHGITPEEPTHITVEGVTLEAFQNSFPFSLSAQSGYFQGPEGEKPRFLFAIEEAPPWFARLLGADFYVLECPHEAVLPRIVRTSAKGRMILRFSSPTWFSCFAGEAGRFHLPLFLAFTGKLGDLSRLASLLPDIICPAPGTVSYTHLTLPTKA